MEWDNVRIFLAVAREGQILAAGRSLGLSHGTVARRLTSLERRIKAKLFDRHTTGCTLTYDGRKFLPAAEAIENEVLRAESALLEQDDCLSGVVRIGVTDSFGLHFLSKELKDLVLENHKLRIQLVPLSLNVASARREVEIALTVDRPTESHLVSKSLVECNLSLYASKAYLAEHGPIQSEEDLAKRVLVTFPPEFYVNAGFDFSAATRIEVDRRFESASMVGQIEAIRHGIGFGVLHDYFASQYADLEVILPELQFKRQYWLAMNIACRGFPRIRAVANCIENAVRSKRQLLQRPIRRLHTNNFMVRAVG